MKLYILIFTLLLCVNVYAMKEPPVQALEDIVTATESIDGKTPADMATVTEQDQTQALIGEVQVSPTENTVLDRLKDILTALTNVTGFGGDFIDIHDADVHVTMINRHVVNVTATNSTLASGATAGDTVITIQNGDMGSFIVGDKISLTEGNTEEPDCMTITAKGAAPPNTLTLDRPLDNDYTTSAVVTKVEEDLTTTAGSLSAPISYRVTPPADETWHLTRMLGTMVMTNDSSFNEFCSVAALSNGLLVRENDGGTWKTLANWKDDATIAETMYDLDAVPKAPAGKAGQMFRWTFKRTSSIVKLEGANGDYLEVAIQDNLTGAIDCEVIHITVQGHKEGE